MRRLLGVLRDVEDAPLLVPQPGLDQLARLVEQAREAGVSADLAIDGAVRSLAPGTDTNVLRHAPGGGTLEAGPREGGGFAVRVWLPTEAA